MKEMPKNYDPKQNESSIFDAWYKGGYFKRSSGREGQEPEAYSIVIPPPNVTGSLHMGHALNDTIQDLLIRHARMQGKRARWILGTDHAGIATQNKVEQKLAKEGLSRFDLGREPFIDKCWEWREEYGSTIVEQLKRMGCSCDFDDEKFTMSPEYQAAVRKVFCDWYRKGLIYRGNRIINWCPRCTTSLSDLETEHEDEKGNLWYIKYPLKEPTEHFEYLTVATTRPETLLGDTAVAVSASDERYAELVGKIAILPFVGREIPVVADQHVDSSFGTGMVKITPAHDPNDFEVGQRHNLEAINVLNADATMNELCGKYAGMDRYEARKAMVADLEELGLLEKIEEHEHAVGHCYRCHTTVEPWLSEQWFVDMKPLAEPAIEAVKQGRVKFTPERWSEVYFQWMENIRDWCISRQLWWGHRIPIFYCDDCGWMDASEEDITVCPKCGKPVRQDEDVLDTWFSSQLWPFATMGWTEDGEAAKELQDCYPTAVLSTARDILFLWVARMIMSSMYFLDGEIPFKDVIIHPTVFNAQGKRMSKSLGTGVDPLELMENYGADGMRFGLMLQVTGAQDLKFSEEKLEYSRNFTTKIWNAARFIMMNLEDFECEGKVTPIAEAIEDKWILSKLASLVERVEDGLNRYDFGEVARELSAFFWNDFCDWYIELSKPRLNAGGAAREAAQRNLIFVLDNALRLLHPFMPYVTEEIWGYLPHGDEAEMLIVAAWPEASAFACYKDEEAQKALGLAQAVISAVRSVRARYAISPKTQLAVTVNASADDQAILASQEALICSLGRVSALALTAEKPAHASTVVAEGLEIYVVVEGYVDFEAEAKRLTAERERTAKELERVSKKLSNPGFLAKAAPEIIEKDREKEATLKEALASLEDRLADLA